MRSNLEMRFYKNSKIMFVMYSIDVFYERVCTSGDLVVKQWTIIYFIGYLQDGGSDVAP